MKTKLILILATVATLSAMADRTKSDTPQAIDTEYESLLREAISLVAKIDASATNKIERELEMEMSKFRLYDAAKQTNEIVQLHTLLAKMKVPGAMEKAMEHARIKKEKEEAKKERLRKMREGAKVVKNPKPPPVAGTGQKLDPNWEKLLKQGYKPSDHTELAPNVETLCYSLIKTAFYDKWDRPPWTDTLKEMVLRVYFGPGGRVVSYKLEKSSGDARADQTVIAAAKAVRVVSGLSEDFIKAKKMSGVPIRFKVAPQ